MKLKTDACELDVDLKTGLLDDFRFQHNDLHPWSDILYGEIVYRRKGGIRVTDELTGQTYRDDFGAGWTYYDEARKSHVHPKGTPFRITKVVCRGKTGGNRVAFCKTFKGAPFRMLYSFTSDRREIRWDVAFELKAGEQARSLRIELVAPTLANPMASHQDHRPGWELWAPLAGAPFAFSHSGGWGHSASSWDMQRFPYSSVNSGNGIGVPVIDLYSAGLDVGLAMAAPFDLPKPELNIEVDKLWGEVRFIYTNIGLRPGTRPVAAMLLHVHAGDWRPALGWLFKKYGDYFTAGDPKIVKQEGPMTYGFPVLSDATIRQWKRDMGFRWTEALFCPSFENLAPREKEWMFDMMAPNSDGPKNRIACTRDMVRQYLRRLNRHGVASFAYFNACECGAEIAERDFSESRMQLDNGRWRKAWIFSDRKRFNWNMNPDPATKWGRHVLAQARRMFAVFPELSGLFFDQLCYRTLDFSRDDGVTMFQNRPCFDTHTVFPRMVQAVLKILRSKGRTVFANGPYNIEVQKGIDGLMSEGSVEGLAKYGYICLAKPLMILTYGSKLPAFEHTLKVCLKFGAFPDVRDHLTQTPRQHISPAEKDVYARYLPLLETLRGRRWVFHPHALVMPPGYDGNVFRSPRGRYIVTFFPEESVSVDRADLCGPREIRLRLPDLGRRRSAAWISANRRGRRRIPVRQVGKSDYVIAVDSYTDASVFVL